jgi:MFS family permease
MTLDSPPDTARLPRIHWAWVVAGVSFVAILGAAGFRSIPGVMMNPLHDEFGWTHGTVGLAMSVNMTLFGVTAPFAAALMDRFGIRPVLTVALTLIATGSALSVTMTASWQLVLFWGVLVGVGTGSISMGFVATIATRWFDQRRGLVTGVLTAASATGQLIFLPVVAEVTTRHGWRTAASAPEVLATGSFRAAFDGLVIGVRVPAFWLLAGSFAICGMTTNGLIGTHFIPAANDHGMPTTLAAGLLATIGVLDVAGTVFSGWLTDRVDPRLLLVVYYAGRGVSLLLLPSLLSPHANPGTWVFIIFYGLDWVATVPPTIVLCRNYFGTRAPVVFGWVFASHQIGAAVAAAGAGWLRDLRGDYDLAFYLAAGLCAIAALLCLQVRNAPVEATRTHV